MDVEAEEIFPLPGGGGGREVVTEVHGIGGEGDADGVEVGAADGLGVGRRALLMPTMEMTIRMPVMNRVTSISVVVSAAMAWKMTTDAQRGWTLGAGHVHPGGGGGIAAWRMPASDEAKYDCIIDF